MFGGPNGNRTRLPTVTVWNTNRYTIGPNLVRLARIELACPAAQDFKSCVSTDFTTVANLVEVVGVEPTVPGAADLQSAGVTNFPTLPCLNYNTLSLCCQPAPNGRSGKRECVLKYTNNATMCTGLHGPAVPIIYFNTN